MKDLSARVRALFERGLLTAAEQYALEWLNSAPNEPDGRAGASLFLGRIRLKSRRYREALEDLRGALTLASAQNAELTARCLTDLSNAFMNLGDWDRAEEFARRATGLCSRLEGQAIEVLGEAWLRLGQSLSQKGHSSEAVEAYRNALWIYHQSGDIFGKAQALNSLGIAEIDLGDPEAARRHLQESFQILSPTGTTLVRNCTELARLHLTAGRLNEAVLMASQALQSLLDDVEILDRSEVGRACEIWGLIFLKMNAKSQALRHLNLAAGYYSQASLSAEWERSVSAIRNLMADPTIGETPSSAHLQDQLDFLTGIMRLTDDFEKWDPLFRGHSERVTTLASAVGKHLGLDSLAMGYLRHASRLHDAGMIALDPRVVSHRGALSAEQTRLLQKHLDHGQGILMTLRLTTTELEAVYCHHERYDGSGYPHGLSGRDIPLLSRIIALAEAYDAMTSPRRFRPALSHRQAVAEILNLKGSQFCPDCVGALIEVFA